MTGDRKWGEMLPIAQLMKGDFKLGGLREIKEEEDDDMEDDEEYEYPEDQDEFNFGEDQLTAQEENAFEGQKRGEGSKDIPVLIKIDDMDDSKDENTVKGNQAHTMEEIATMGNSLGQSVGKSGPREDSKVELRSVGEGEEMSKLSEAWKDNHIENKSTPNTDLFSPFNTAHFSQNNSTPKPNDNRGKFFSTQS